MKGKVISLIAILILLFTVIHCKQVVSSFSPHTEDKDQADSTVTTETEVSTKTNVTDMRYVELNRKRTDFHKDPIIRNDSRIDPIHSNMHVSKRDVKTKVSDFATGILNSSDNLKMHTENKGNDKEDLNSKDKEKDQDLYVQIQPSKWNINWAHSEGLVTVRIRGIGYRDINPDSIKLAYDDGGEINNPFMAKVSGGSFFAKFFKKDAIGMIPDPQGGSSYVIQVTGEMNDGSSFGPLSVTITVVGEKSDEEDEKDETELSLEIKPEEWDPAWANDGEDGEVTARIKGEGFENIDSESVVMAYGSCEDSNGLSPITPVFSEFGEEYFEAMFSRSDAIGLIVEPELGEMHEIHVAGTLSGGEAFCLTYMITIEGEEPDEEELSLEIKPEEWDPAWANDGEDGEVTARIKGEGFENIDPESVVMAYGSCEDSNGLSPITPVFSEFGEEYFEAKFSRSDAIGLIVEPELGEMHEIHVAGTLSGGEAFCLTYMITIEGEEPDEEELSLKIKPDKWNPAWANDGEDGKVTARIQGEGFENIDPDSVLMKGPEGVIVKPFATKLKGDSFIAKFSKSEVISIIDNPQAGDRYEIHVLGELEDASTFDLYDTITIKRRGKKK